MAQYSNLKAYIEEKIYENGTQAITGDILQDVLKVMTDDLGEFYQMGGVASPSTDPGTPDAKVIYFATEAGTYTNFGGITLAAGEVALLIFETSWTKETLNVLSAANGGVKTANLADGAVTTEKIAGGAVETSKIANNAVTSGKVADGAIGTAKIADGAIDADKIAANAVESAKIKNGAVTEGKINDGAVTAGKIASNAVTTAKIADDAVTTAKLNDGAVTEDKIATDAVTSGKVKDGAIGTAKIAAGAVTHAKIGAGAVEESNIKDGAVTSDKIADGAVGNDQLAEGAFSAENLADGSVTTDKLADDAVTAEKIADGAVTAGKFADGSVSTAKLASGAVITEKIGDGMVTRQKLADSSVGTSKIIDGAVTTDKVADGAITDAKLENPVSVSQNTETKHAEINVGGVNSPVASVEEIININSKLDGTAQNYAVGGWNTLGGNAGSSSWYRVLDYIPVLPNDTIIWNPGEVNGGIALCRYDSGKEFIGFFGANAETRTLTIPTDTAYIRPSFAKSNIDNAKIIRNGMVIWLPQVSNEGLVTKVGTLETKVNDIETVQFEKYFVGNGSTFAESSPIYNLIPGNKYRIYIRKDNWDTDGIETGENYVFNIKSIYDGSPTILDGSSRKSITPNYFEFTVPTQSDYIKIGGRAKSGNKCYFYVTELATVKDYSNEIKYGIGCVTTANGGHVNTITVANHKVSLDSNGIRINFFGKQVIVVGPFDMPYDSTNQPSGAWVIDRQTLIDAADGASITATGSIIKYAASGTSAIKNNVILFTCYYGVIFPVGILGPYIEDIENKKSMKDVSLLAIDMLNGAFKNVVIDKNNKKIIIKKEGLRLKLYDRKLILSGSSDFEMSYDSTNYPNGGWFLKKEAIENAAADSTIALSSDNIVAYNISSTEYNGNILLFPYYYGSISPAGVLADCILQREVDSINEKNPSVEVNEAKCKQFAAYFNNSGICETFSFMTDPHLLGLSNTFNEETFTQYIKTLQTYYDNTPVDWCICGGDWLNNGDNQDIACWKLGYMDATMRKSFKHYFPVLGNHDTNYQGVVSAGDSSRGDLTHQTLINLMFRENGNSYYKFKGNNTQFYVFDTGIDWATEMDSFKWGQIDWFAKSLIEDDAVHTVLIQHIFYTSGTNVNPMATNIQAVAGAYNSRTTLTLNGETYDFTGCTGKIACVIAGHSHFDAIVTENVSVPVWLTTNMMDGGIPTFDLCIIDYTAGKMRSVRIGTGSDREMTLA